DLAIGRERQGIADPAQLPAADIALLAARARADRHDLDRTAATGGQRIALALDQSGNARPDRAQTGNAKFQWSRHRRPVWKRSLLAPLGQGNDVVQLFGTGFKKAADIARGLADALLVLDPRNPHVSLAIFAEPAAGRDRDLGLFDQQRGELDAAEGLERLGYRRPSEHGGARRRNLPARASKRFHQYVAPAFVGLAHLADAVLGAVERGGRCHLDRSEGA